MWTRYEFQRGFARGLAFGFGARHYTNQSGDWLDTFHIPGYELVDSSISYERRHFRIQLNSYNLTNSRYFLGSTTTCT